MHLLNLEKKFFERTQIPEKFKAELKLTTKLKKLMNLNQLSLC